MSKYGTSVTQVSLYWQFLSNRASRQSCVTCFRMTQFMTSFLWAAQTMVMTFWQATTITPSISWIVRMGRTTSMSLTTKRTPSVDLWTLPNKHPWQSWTASERLQHARSIQKSAWQLWLRSTASLSTQSEEMKEESKFHLFWLHFSLYFKNILLLHKIFVYKI